MKEEQLNSAEGKLHKLNYYLTPYWGYYEGFDLSNGNYSITSNNKYHGIKVATDIAKYVLSSRYINVEKELILLNNDKYNEVWNIDNENYPIFSTKNIIKQEQNSREENPIGKIAINRDVILGDLNGNYPTDTQGLLFIINSKDNMEFFKKYYSMIAPIVKFGPGHKMNVIMLTIHDGEDGDEPMESYDLSNEWSDDYPYNHVNVVDNDGEVTVDTYKTISSYKEQ